MITILQRSAMKTMFTYFGLNQFFSEKIRSKLIVYIFISA